MDLVTPLVAGAAGALITQLTGKGAEWLIQLVSSHSPAVQAQVQRNLQSFINRLAKRVERLEAELSPEQRGVFEDALDHPNSSLLMQKAMVSAATTDNDDRHTILSELIAQRLTAAADDMISLVGAASCDVVNALSSKHIKLLGLLARLYAIRPLNAPDINDQDEYDKYIVFWWEPLGKLCDDLEEVKQLDLQHLLGLSCISIMHFLSRDLRDLLALSVKSGSMKPSIPKLEVFPWWLTFRRIWDVGLQRVDLTSVGLLIGTLYHDSHLKSQTQIDWK